MTTSRPTSIAVVIATRDRPVLLKAALQAIARSTRPPDRVVVADSASSDPRVAQVAAAAGATVIRCTRAGTCRARNVGWNAVDTDLVAFVDDDCLVEPNWLEQVVKAFDDPSGPGFVTGQVRSDVEPAARAGLAVAVHVDPEPRILRLGDDPKTMGHGANMAWRRELLERIGGFDEMLGPGAALRAAEDLDVFWRALMSGATGYYVPDAVVVHRQWRTRTGMLRAYHGYGVGTGAFTMKRYRLAREAPDTRQGPSGVRMLVVDEGLAPVVHALAEHYEMGALAELAKFAGSLRGARRARRLRVVDGHFVARATDPR
jgi:GT2 family glycosyltransferase